MKKFTDYLTPPPEPEKPLSLTEKAWLSAKEKLKEPIKVIRERVEPPPAPVEEPQPIVEEVQEEQVEEEVSPEAVQRLIESLTGPQGEPGPMGPQGEKATRAIPANKV